MTAPARSPSGNAARRRLPILAALGIGAALGFAVGNHTAAGSAPDPSDTWARIQDDIAMRHPEPPTRKALIYASIHGMIGALDRWTRFYAPDEVVEATVEPADVGLGATVVPDACGLRVTQVENPAAAAGLKVDDCIRKVDGVSIVDTPPESRTARLLGASRTACLLELSRPGAAKSMLVAVQRGWRAGAPLESSQLGAGPEQVTVLRLSSFPTGVTALWSPAAQQTAARSRRVIVDLRGNMGGDLNEAVRLVERFATEGVIVRTDVRGEGPRTYNATNSGDEVTVPLIVLVDERTASAAEIAAAALQALAQARVVGRPAVGKRSIQTTLRYEDGSAMQLTIGHFTVAGDPHIDQTIAAGADEGVWWEAAGAAIEAR